MANTLSDLITDLKTASTGNFNKFAFGYLGEINSFRASSTFPLMMLLPPDSSFSDVYKGDETYNCVFHCYIFNAEALDNNQNGLQSSFDTLKDFFDSTIQTLVRNNESKYILAGSLNVERVSREFNDNVVGIVCTLPIKAFTTCYSY